MRIVILGANGQVGSEVCLYLASRDDIDLVPVCRTRGGSSFLRYRGVRCFHADISQADQAKKLLSKADVIASFALPLGNPASSRRSDRKIIDNILEHAPHSAAFVFFSTLAVHGSFDVESGRMKMSHYGRSKLAAERYLLRQAARKGKCACALRLGHVAGELQGITRFCREQIKAHCIKIVDPQRASNIVHTVAIADMLVRMGASDRPTPGIYDLVNVPNWTWGEVFEHEAQAMGMTCMFERVPQPRRYGRFRPLLLARALIGSAPGISRIREPLMSMISVLPEWVGDEARATHALNRTKSETAGLGESSIEANTAVFWPPLGSNVLPGLAQTSQLLAKWRFRDAIEPWPPDLDI